MKIKAENYSIESDLSQAVIHFQGSLLLNGAEEYVPIVQLLNEVVEQQPDIITLDIQKLLMLNSSGFQMLSKFVINVRQFRDIQLFIRGNQKTSWQTRSLQNLRRLMPAIEIEFE
jgi:hypothetical protein